MPLKTTRFQSFNFLFTFFNQRSRMDENNKPNLYFNRKKASFWMVDDFELNWI